MGKLTLWGSHFPLFLLFSQEKGQEEQKHVSSTFLPSEELAVWSVAVPGQSLSARLLGGCVLIVAAGWGWEVVIRP